MDRLLRPRSAMFSIHWDTLLQVLAKLAIAFLIALPVAWERERQTRLMGLRTFPIVALACCSYILIARELFGNDQAQARVLQGLLTGMGFIGGGAILKREGKVEGTATAASLWATGAVGTAVAYGRLEIAIAVTIIVFLTLRFLTPLEEKLLEEQDVGSGGDPERAKQP